MSQNSDLLSSGPGAQPSTGAVELNQRLQPLREHIDTLDAQLLTLLNQRAKIALEIGEIKKRSNAVVFNPQREKHVISRLQNASNGPLSDEHIAAIWREIMAASRALERNLTVAFLGPQGTYSELAMRARFGQATQGLACLTIDEIFRSVESGSADFGVVPVENSSEGIVSRTLDILLQSPLSISAEVVLPIQHNLMARHNNLASVTTVCAHPQALAQCQNWLSTQAPQLERRAVASNAEAARLAAHDDTIAALASEHAAACYGLQILHSKVQDDPHNRTRFAVIGESYPASTGCDQTSFILSVENQPGAIYHLLEPLAKHDVTILHLASRPARNGAWEYYFYIDVAGHQDDASLAVALRELHDIASFIKILGSYPRAL
jgi:chorismate mutase/prephenate dehydratase